MRKSQPQAHPQIEAYNSHFNGGPGEACVRCHVETHSPAADYPSSLSKVFSSNLF